MNYNDYIWQQIFIYTEIPYAVLKMDEEFMLMKSSLNNDLQYLETYDSLENAKDGIKALILLSKI